MFKVGRKYNLRKKQIDGLMNMKQQFQLMNINGWTNILRERYFGFMLYFCPALMYIIAFRAKHISYIIGQFHGTQWQRRFYIPYRYIIIDILGNPIYLTF